MKQKTQQYDQLTSILLEASKKSFGGVQQESLDVMHSVLK